MGWGLGAVLSRIPTTDQRSRWVHDSPIWYWSSNLVTRQEPRLTYLVLELKPGHRAGTVTHLSGTGPQTWSSGRNHDSPIWYWSSNLVIGQEPRLTYLVLELEPGHRAGTTTHLSGTGAQTWSSGRNHDSPIWYWSSNLVIGQEPRLTYLVLEFEPSYRAETTTHLSGTGAQTWSPGRDCDSPIWYWTSNLVIGQEPRLTYLVLKLKPGHRAGTTTHLSGPGPQTWSSGRNHDSPIWYWSSNLVIGQEPRLTYLVLELEPSYRAGTTTHLSGTGAQTWSSGRNHDSPIWY